MKKCAYIILLFIAIISLCSYGINVTEKNCTVFSNGKYFYVVDTAELSYKLCENVFDDTYYIVGREMGSGKITYTDSMLIFMRNEYKCPMIKFSNEKKVKKGHTKVMIIDAERYNLKSIQFYSNESTETKAEYHPINDKVSHKCFELPIEVGALQIDFADENTPLKELDSLNRIVETLQHKKNVSCLFEKLKNPKLKYNMIWIGGRNLPLYRDVQLYFRGDKDTLISKACFSRPYDIVSLVLDRRRVITFKDENFCPPLFF